MDRILLWWTGVNFKIRIISILILVVSILMTATTFGILDNLRRELACTNLRLRRDLYDVVAHYVVSISQNSRALELEDFIERLYLSTSSVASVGILDLDDNLLFSFPANPSCSQTSVACFDQLFIHFPAHLFFSATGLKAHCLKHKAFDFVSPLLCYDSNYGSLRLGLSFSSSPFHAIRAVQVVSATIFAVAWLMFALGMFFNCYAVSSPTKKILTGLQHITSGHFGYQVDNRATGSIGDIIIGFNEMSRRLLLYEKRNVTQLISEKARLEALVSAIADGAILLDSELRLLFVNQVAVKALNCSNKGMIGEIIFQYLPVHVNEALLPLLNTMIRLSCLDNQRLQTQAVDINLHHGSMKTFRFLLSAILSYKNRSLYGIVITIQDVTREAQLNGAKSQFISNVSHELRTPLCNIGSFLETLIDYNYRLTDAQKNKFLLIAYSETQRLGSLVSDVLDLSKLDSEYCYYVLNSVSIASMASYIIKASHIVALNKKVQIDREISFQSEKALAHASSLCQVLSNLISNSLKFTHQGGKIVVRIYPLFANYTFVSSVNKVNLVRIEIIDEGIGVEKMYQKQIFDRFVRIENSVHMLKGTGLGLSIVKNIVEKHNSSIKMYSEAGIGTTFWFDLLTTD